jgi:hypothetical protein
VCEFSGSEVDFIRENEDFYTIIVEPMVGWCAMTFYALPLILIQTQRDILCETVKQLKALYTDLWELYNKQKKENTIEAKVEIDKKLRQIKQVILQDLYDLKGIYEDLLTSAVFERIEVQVKRIADRNLGAKFEQIHAELVDKLKMGEGINSKGRDTIPNRKLAYELLLIRKKMESLIHPTDVEETLQWAFRQFAANLTVIHTMRLDRTDTYHLYIQRIGAKWPIVMGMKTAESSTMG